jgi:hypothetical protein
MLSIFKLYLFIYKQNHLCRMRFLAEFLGLPLEGTAKPFDVQIYYFH